jgi:electron transport protein HydN
MKNKNNFDIKICKKCKTAPCIMACTYNALEKDQENNIQKNEFQCQNCKTCALACPFGAII